MADTSIHVFRLVPGDDLRLGIEQFVRQQNIFAGWISACVGSLQIANLRFANQRGGTASQGPFEILSLSGTLSINGSHLHICIADGRGETIGGHLLNGCKIFTTAEIVIISTTDLIFSRKLDANTGFTELNVEVSPQRSMRSD